jgi:hypothetical protein
MILVGRKRKLPVEQAEEVNPKRSRKHEVQEQQPGNYKKFKWYILEVTQH